MPRRTPDLDYRDQLLHALRARGVPVALLAAVFEMSERQIYRAAPLQIAPLQPTRAWRTMRKQANRKRRKAKRR